MLQHVQMSFNNNALSNFCLSFSEILAFILWLLLSAKDTVNVSLAAIKSYW